MKSKAAFRNSSPNGWWICSYIIRFVWLDEPNPRPKSRCVASENTILLKAAGRERAYRKALRLAKSEAIEYKAGLKGRPARWVFEGLTSLLPVYGPLEDGVEVLWVDHRNRTVAKIQSMVRSREGLEAFDDSLIDDSL